MLHLIPFIVIFIIAFLAYAWVTMGEVRELREIRMGRRRELAADLGEWKPDLETTAGRQAQQAGMIRERRLWLYEGGLLRRGRLVEQFRVRDPRSGDVVSVEPERRIDLRHALSTDDSQAH